MDNIYFLIIFIFPGVFITMIYDRLFPAIQQDVSKYKEVVQSFIISSFILLANLLLIKLIYGSSISSWDNFKAFILNFNNSVIFFAITLGLSIIGAYVYYLIVDKLIIWLVNLPRNRKKLAPESKFPTPWHEFFENPDFNINNRVVGIFKGNDLITIGYIDNYSSPGAKEKEFKIIYSDWFLKQYIKDSTVDKEEKVFDKIDAEYYDMTNNVLIKFFNSDKINSKMTTKTN